MVAAFVSVDGRLQFRCARGSFYSLGLLRITNDEAISFQRSASVNAKSVVFWLTADC